MERLGWLHPIELVAYCTFMDRAAYSCVFMDRAAYSCTFIDRAAYSCTVVNRAAYSCTSPSITAGASVTVGMVPMLKVLKVLSTPVGKGVAG